MSMRDGILGRLRGLLGANDGSGSGQFDVEAQAKRLAKSVIIFPQAAEANAAANRTLTHIYTAKDNVRVTQVEWISDTAENAHASNYATFALKSGNGAAVASTVVANVATTVAGGGNIAVGTPYALTLQAANVNIDAGETLAVDILKAGSGVALGAGSWVIHLEER